MQDGHTVIKRAEMEVGQCFFASELSGSQQDPDAYAYPCPTAKAPYELVSHKPIAKGCPDGKRAPDTLYTTIDEEGTKRRTAIRPDPVEVVFCFALNMPVGETYLKDDKRYFEIWDHRRAASDREGYIEGKQIYTVVSQIDNEPDAACAAGQLEYRWPEPQRVLCLIEQPADYSPPPSSTDTPTPTSLPAR